MAVQVFGAHFCGSFSNFARNSAFFDMRFSKFNAKRLTHAMSIFSTCTRQYQSHVAFASFDTTHSCISISILSI
jgi:hypothetical protein